MDGIPIFQLLLELLRHHGQILRVNDCGHPVPHGCKLIPAVPDEFKKAVVGVNDREILVKPAAENPAGNIVVKVQHLVLGRLLSRNVHTHRSDGGPAVLRHSPAPQIVNPDVGSVLLLHPVVHRVLVLFRQLGGQQTVHLFPVVRMPAVGNQTADISGKLRLVLISQVVQHMAVNEIKRKSRLHIPAHHAARHGIVQKFLPLPGNVLHHQGLGIMLASGLILTRLRHVDPKHLPLPLLQSQYVKTAQIPGVVSISQRKLRRQIANAFRRSLFVNHGNLTGKRLGNLGNILAEVFSHRLLSPGRLPLARSHKAHVLREKRRGCLQIPQFKPVVAKFVNCLNGC